jgi:tRNA nucleotidyltransferase (CCA-adding enzyme)
VGVTSVADGFDALQLVSVSPSGSFAKGTANKSGTDIDLFISLSQNTRETLKEIYNKLFARMTERGYAPKPQNVSINIQVNGYRVDLGPANVRTPLAPIIASTAAKRIHGRKQTL